MVPQGKAPVEAMGQTFKPGYGYLSVKTLYATNAGGSTVGPSFSNAMFPIPTGHLSMHCGGNQASATPVNLQSNGSSGGGGMPPGCVLAAPQELGQMVPQWANNGGQIHAPVGQNVPLSAGMSAPGGSTPTMAPGGSGSIGGGVGGGAPAPAGNVSPQSTGGCAGGAMAGPCIPGGSAGGSAGGSGAAPAQAPAGVAPPKFGAYGSAAPSGIVPQGTASPAGTGIGGVAGGTGVPSAPHGGPQPLPYHGSGTILLPSLVTGRLSTMLVGALLLSVALL